MKTEVNKIDESNRQISVEVSGEIVKNKFEDVFKKIGQEAKVPGFRAGHVPRDILEKNFSAAAHDQVLKELIPDIYNQAIEKEAIDAIDMPQISDIKLDRNSISFKAKVEIKPEIKLASYKGIKLEYKKIAVSADDLKRSLDSLKESRKLDVLDDAFARGLGYSGLAALEKFLEAQIYIQKQNHERKKLEDNLIESIMKDLDFKAPQSLINRQQQELIRQAKMDLAMKGLPREKIEEHEKELEQECSSEARKQVRIYLVLSEIAKKENIPQDDQMPARVIEFLLKEALWSETA